MGPRPLSLHMAMEGWILQMSFAGLMPSNGALPPLSPALNRSDLVQQVAAEALQKNPDQIGAAWDQYLDPVAFLNSITRQSKERMETFVAGVKAYQAHAYRRELEAPAPVWQNGSARLIDYAPNGGGRPVLLVPSLINRAYILDLAEDRSLMRAAAAAGLHPFLLDWGAPNEAEKRFAVEDYVEGILIPALEEVRDTCGRAPALVGYCMGGTLCVAPAVLRPELVDRLVLLVAPWDFHAESEASRMLIGLSRPALEVMLEAEGAASVDLLQALFASLDPTLVGRKFRNFANLDPMSEQARRFVELEDWLNDGVPLAGPVAREVIFNWYGDNAPAGKKWMIGQNVIDPARISCPTIAFIPGQDRIVPPDSARKLAAEIPNAEVFDINLGHIGMISGGSAPKRVYEPLIQWLKPDE